MKKNTLNYLVDSIMFILMLSIVGVGFLMKYVLISGQERWIEFGRNVELTFMGMERHAWGKIHLILGLILVAFLTLHLILHWGSITRFVRKIFINRFVRISVTSVFLAISLLLVIFPFFIRINIIEVESGYGRLYQGNSGRITDTTTAVSARETPEPENDRAIKVDQPKIEKVEDRAGEYHKAILSEIDIQGYMTLYEVSIEYNVPADRIKESLNIPLHISEFEKLGQLRKRYNFTMTDVKEIIHKEQNK